MDSVLPEPQLLHPRPETHPTEERAVQDPEKGAHDGAREHRCGLFGYELGGLDGRGPSGLGGLDVRGPSGLGGLGESPVDLGSWM